jgi:septum site-determining protein MinC
VDDSQPLVIRRTIRSGQVVRHAGTVIVLGDINPGAEVIANGDVIVWGKLRGVVHAGAAGDLRATVGALLLMPTQLRIADHIARAPDDKRVLRWPAEIARVRDGRIIVEPWGTS